MQGTNERGWDPAEVVQFGSWEGKTLQQIHDELLAEVEPDPLPRNEQGELNQTAQQRRNLFEAQFDYAMAAGLL